MPQDSSTPPQSGANDNSKESDQATQLARLSEKFSHAKDVLTTIRLDLENTIEMIEIGETIHTNPIKLEEWIKIMEEERDRLRKKFSE